MIIYLFCGYINVSNAGCGSEQKNLNGTVETELILQTVYH